MVERSINRTRSQSIWNREQKQHPVLSGKRKAEQSHNCQADRYDYDPFCIYQKDLLFCHKTVTPSDCPQNTTHLQIEQAFFFSGNKKLKAIHPPPSAGEFLPPLRYFLSYSRVSIAPSFLFLSRTNNSRISSIRRIVISRCSIIFSTASIPVSSKSANCCRAVNCLCRIQTILQTPGHISPRPYSLFRLRRTRSRPLPGPYT